MGHGLAFLNKKTWHPSSNRNLEEKWKREQQAAAEAKKLEELQKQLQDERKHGEFLQLAAETGHLRKGERLDWMYGSGLQAKQDADKRREDMLMGKADVVVPAEKATQEAPRVEQAALLPSFYATATPASQNETWLRLNNDPLFAIKRQQQEQLAKVRENPIKMMELLKNLQQSKKDKDDSKKSKKDKKEKKDKKSKEHKDKDGRDGRSVSRSRSRSPPAAGRGAAQYEQPPLKRQRAPAAAVRPGLPEGWVGSSGQREDGLSHQHSSERRGADAGWHHEGHYTRERERHRERERRDDRARDSDRPPIARGDDDRGVQGAGTACDRRQGDGADAPRRRHDAAEEGRGRYDREREHDRGRPDDGRRRGPEYGGKGDAGRRGTAADERNRHHDDHGREQGGRNDCDTHGDAKRRSYDGGRGAHEAADERHDRYGLKHSNVAPTALLQADTSARAAETRARLEEARLAREAEERDKAAQRYQRREYKTGRLTEDERKSRLAEMMGNADAHEEQRMQRLAKASEADRAEDKIVSHADAARGADAFKAAASRDVYGALSAAAGSLEARVGSRRHYNAH